MFLDNFIHTSSSSSPLGYSVINQFVSLAPLLTTRVSAYPIMFRFLLLTCVALLQFLLHFALAFPMPWPVPDPRPQADRPQHSGIYPDPEPCMGNCSWIHDPSVIYEDGMYWRFSTSGNIAVAIAPSLGGPWTYKGPLLTNSTKIFIREDQDIWVH